MTNPENPELEQQMMLEHLKTKNERICDMIGRKEAQTKFDDLARDLLAKYSDARDYLAFHVLIGSGCDGIKSKVDFFGDDSVEKFFDSIIASAEKKE
ncbi:MAG: hypothetical protein WC480_00265 [Patescibacteria group bacterium]